MDNSVEQWFIGFKPLRFETSPCSDLSGFEFFYPEPGAHYADPFLVFHDDLPVVFYEMLPKGSSKGVVCYTTIKDCEFRTEYEVVMEKPYHLSYPHVFEYDGAFFMIPETAQNRTIELYQCTSFPNVWKLERTLFRDLYAVDSTLLQLEGKFWLFTNIVLPDRPPATDLYLFYSDSLFGNWIPHPLNPIVSNRKTARPAGNVICDDGMLVRPGQDCSEEYGKAVSLCHVTRINEREYEEELFRQISPSALGSNILGTHTINSCGGITVLDAKRRVSLSGL